MSSAIGALGRIAERGSQYEALKVSKACSGVPVLRDVSVSFKPGEIHSLVGENGAGKSTLLKILAGVYSPDAGQLVMDGAEQSPLTPASAQRKGIYLVPQEPRLMPDLSVAENLFLGALPRGRMRLTVDWARANRDTGELLSAVGLELDPRVLAGGISLAHQQLIECARALAHGCSVIFFDEPTSPLTSHDAGKLFALMSALRARGLTLGFISHRLDEVEEISDRVTVLRDGAVIASTARGEATRSQLIESMVGRALTLTGRREQVGKRGKIALRIQGIASEPEVQDISLEVREAEIVGLAGLVGSGRTELGETVFGLRDSSAGTVLLYDRDITGYSPSACVEAGLVYVAEDRGRNGLFAEVDMTRNATAATISRVPRSAGLINALKERTAARDALMRMGVRAVSMNLPIKSLSGGNQQKALLARWVMASPKVAIFDEPTRGVDVGSKEGIFQIIESLAAEGLAALVISSELDELVRLCDRVYVVYEGRVVGEVAGDDVTLETVGKLAVAAS
jgi:ABC-type sugar transport system ATPase subunit